MYTQCPDCNKKVEMRINEFDASESEFDEFDARVPIYVQCPNCYHHFIGTAIYDFNALVRLRHDDDYEYEDEED